MLAVLDTLDLKLTMNKPLITGILISCFSASMGFGLSQLTVIGEVKQHSTEIKNLLKDTGELRNDFREMIKQNQEFIQLLRTQNELLRQRLP